jgi:hypothetical protein
MSSLFGVSIGVRACMSAFQSTCGNRKTGLLLLLVTLLVLGVACGSSGNTGTPKASYTVTVTGTSDSYTHATTVSCHGSVAAGVSQPNNVLVVF